MARTPSRAASLGGLGGLGSGGEGGGGSGSGVASGVVSDAGPALGGDKLNRVGATAGVMSAVMGANLVPGVLGFGDYYTDHQLPDTVP